jgi:hypothetical protein
LNAHLKIQKEAAELRQTAIKELLRQQTDIQQKLTLLGHVGGSMPKRGRPKKEASSKLCKVCGKPGHDGRKHRWEKAKKKH